MNEPSIALTSKSQQDEECKKKSSSFLIRDILANTSKNSQQYKRDQLFNWVLKQRANLEEWKNHYLTLWNLASHQPSFTNKNQAESNVDDDSSNHLAPLNPIVRNLLGSNNHVQKEKLMEDSNSEECDIQAFGDHDNNPIVTDKLFGDQIQTRFYQNLCYYAIQQQINAKVISSCKSINKQNDDQNEVPSCSNQATLATSIAKPKKKKQAIKSSTTKANLTNMRRCLSSNTSKSNKVNNTRFKNNKIDRKMMKSSSTENDKNNTLTSLEMIINMSNDMIQQDPDSLESPNNESHLNLILTHHQQADSDCRGFSKFKKIRRNRTVFTELQLMGLERRFDSQKYLSTPDRTDLARALGLTQLQVKTWYQNRRMKWKKQVMQNGCPYPPTKPKGRPKKDSIPTYGLEFTNSILCPLMNGSSHQQNTNE